MFKFDFYKCQLVKLFLFIFIFFGIIMALKVCLLGCNVGILKIVQLNVANCCVKVVFDIDIVLIGEYIDTWGFFHSQ